MVLITYNYGYGASNSFSSFNFTMVYGTYNELVPGVYEPTYNILWLGGPNIDSPNLPWKAPRNPLEISRNP